MGLENSANFYLCFQLALFHSVSYFFFLYQSPSSSLCTVFHSTSSNTDKVLLINPSANVFVFGDFNMHHKDWLTYSGGTDWSGEFCYNFSFSKDLTQMVNFPTQILDCDSQSPALLDLFLSSDGSIWSTMVFPPPLGNSDHAFVPVSIYFPHYSQQDPLFLRIAYDYSPWENSHISPYQYIVHGMFHGRISLNSVLLMLLTNFVSRFRLELIYRSLIESIR